MEQLIEALKNNKNNLLYFYNKNCGHCKQLQPKINLLENKNIGKFFQYDTHKNVGISNAFEIIDQPHSLFFIIQLSINNFKF